MTVPFQPLPLFGTGHRQTILGHLMRKWQRDLPAVLRRIPLEDGSQLHAYDSIPTGWQATQPAVIIIHGLGGCHTSGSVLGLGWKAYRQGWRVIRLNLRGSGASLPDNKLPYHAGCSVDIAQTLQAVTSWAPEATLHLVGLSLGGNIVLKFAGEYSQASFPALRHVVAVSPPVDLERSSRMLAERHNAMYETRFVQELVAAAEQRARVHGETLKPFPAKLKLREFDDMYTAHRVGYRDVTDYYARASSHQFLHRVDIPTHILSAEDDPMIDPVPIRDAARSATVTIHLTRTGGHLGYVSRPGRNGWFWMEQYVMQQLQRRDRASMQQGK